METFDSAITEQACARTSGLISRIDLSVFGWISRKAKLDKGWTRYMAARQDVVSQMPPQWAGMAQAQCAFAAIFCDPAVLRKFRKSAADELDATEVAFCKTFEERPWRFSLFTVEDPLGRDFYRIADHLGGEGGILQSNSVTNLLRLNKKLFFSLLLDNGACLQTYGTVAYFNNIGPKDLAYFADAVHGEALSGYSLADRISAQPLPFLFLFAYADAPTVKHGKEEVRFLASEREFNPMGVPIPGKYLDAGDSRVARFRFGGENFFDAQFLYLDAKLNKAVLIAQTRKGYHAAVKFLKPYLDLPDQPDMDLNPIIIAAAEKLTGASQPYGEYSDRFQKKPDPTEEDDLGALNQAMATIFEAYNSGLPLDIEQVARESGVSEEVVPELRRILEGMDNRFSIELPFGISGYVPPPPADRRRMGGSFKENSLFSTYPSPKAQLLYQRGRADRIALLLEYCKSKDFELEEFPDSLEEINEKFWVRDDRTVLNCTVAILGDQGESYHEAREYACEVLRMFHQVLLNQTGEEEVRRFIRTYGRFLYLVLKPAGFIETDKTYELKDIRSGSFKVRSTEFFREWIRFR